MTKKLSAISDQRSAGRALSPKAPRFFGQTYTWNTPNAGAREIGVLGTASGQYYVGYWCADHVGCRLNTHRLPVCQDPDHLQTLLDAWAKERGLEVFSAVSAFSARKVPS